MACDRENAEVAAEALAGAVAGPRRVRGDAGEVEQHNLKDLIEVQKHLASKCAAKSPRRGILFTRLKPPGAV